MPTPTRANLLVAAHFAPRLDDPATRQEAVWAWNEVLYDQDIIDPNYSMEDARVLIDRAFVDPSFIADADLPTVRAMSTFLSRAERLCDGWLDQAAENGVAAALALRLGVLGQEATW